MAASESDMLWQPATVLTAEPGRLLVSFEPLSQCRRCMAGQGCGAGVFGRLFPARTSSLVLSTQQSFKPGQKVRVGLRPAQLLRASLVLYGAPLAGFLLGLLLGNVLFQGLAYGEWLALVLAVFSGAGLLLVLRVRRLVLNPVVQALSCNEVPSALESAPD
jgi:sigma-E factor negative regulatory protein RseC